MQWLPPADSELWWIWTLLVGGLFALLLLLAVLGCGWIAERICTPRERRNESAPLLPPPPPPRIQPPSPEDPGCWAYYDASNRAPEQNPYTMRRL